jgi:hypothetical protein
VYWATLSDIYGVFTYTCRAYQNTSEDSGFEINPFTIKCDVTVNATKFWASTADCSDAKRYVGLLAYIAAAKIDHNADINQTDSTGQAGITFDNAGSFYKWKPTFEDKVSGDTYDVNAQVTNITDALNNLPSEVTAVKQIVFSFLSPKSQTNVFVRTSKLLYITHLVVLGSNHGSQSTWRQSTNQRCTNSSRILCCPHCIDRPLFCSLSFVKYL